MTKKKASTKWKETMFDQDMTLDELKELLTELEWPAGPDESTPILIKRSIFDIVHRRIVELEAVIDDRDDILTRVFEEYATNGYNILKEIFDE